MDERPHDYDDDDDDDDDDGSNRYFLLVSNARADGKPEAFTNTLMKQIEGSKGGVKEAALININLPTCWHGTTADTVAGHAFLLQVDESTGGTASWKNFQNGICSTNDNLVPFADNAILGSFPNDIAYETVREYLQKGILDPQNVYLDAVGLPAESAELTYVSAGDPRVYLEGAVNNGKGLAPNSYVINILFNEKTAGAISLYPNDFTNSHTLWKDGNIVKKITSQTPRGQTRWYMANNYMQLFVDQPVKMKKDGSVENNFQMFYIYMSILETRFVGNKQYRLLGAIPNPGKRDQENSFSYDYTVNPPIYLPLEQRSHRQIDIMIKDDQDRPIFFEWGVTSILIHLRSR